MNIILSCGRTGVVTPVAELGTVFVSGTQVSNATLHNADYIAAKDIRIGDRVLVHKAGEIIPEVLKVIAHAPGAQPYVFPLTCPSCGTKLVKSVVEAAIRCANKHCPAQVAEKIVHFASRDALNIEGLGPANVELLIQAAKIADVSDLYELSRDDVLQLARFAEKSADNLITAIAASKSAPLAKVLFGLGIRHVGEKTALLLAQRFLTMESIAVADIDTIKTVETCGGIVAQSIVEYFADVDNMNMVKRLINSGLTARQQPAARGKLSGKKFVITGTLPTLKRNEAAHLIEVNGGKVLSSVSANVDYIVAGSEAGSKLDKAQKLSLRILDEDGLRQLIDA